jgi:membrane carboxypeptidase/penicillin-binding protein PbpC
VGNNDNSPMGKVASGVSGASPIWRRIMLLTVPKRNKQDFPIPDKIVSLEVDKVSGWQSHDSFPAKTDYFIDGTQPNGSDPIHLQLKVCKDKAGLAPPEDVKNNNYNTKEFFRFVEDDPISSDGKNRWQEGIDGWISGQSDKDKYYPPSDYCRTDGMVSVNFDLPNDRQTVSNNFDIKISTSSLKKINEVKFWVNGKDTKTWSERPFETSLHLDDGLYTLKVQATDKDGASNTQEIKIGVNKPWDWASNPDPLPTHKSRLLS